MEEKLNDLSVAFGVPTFSVAPRLIDSNCVFAGHKPSNEMWKCDCPLCRTMSLVFLRYLVLVPEESASFDTILDHPIASLPNFIVPATRGKCENEYFLCINSAVSKKAFTSDTNLISKICLCTGACNKCYSNMAFFAGILYGDDMDIGRLCFERNCWCRMWILVRHEIQDGDATKDLLNKDIDIQPCQCAGSVVRV